MQATHRAAIRRVLKEDKFAGSSANYAQVAAAMQSISLTGTPSDFAEAFTRHRQAWGDAARLEAEWKKVTSEDNINMALIGGGLCLFLECEENPISSQIDAENRIKSAREQASRNINETFQVVEQVAARYGAAI